MLTFQIALQTGSLDIPLEALESDVEKPPSEVQPKELEAMLEGIEATDVPISAPPKGPVAFAVGVDKDQVRISQNGLPALTFPLGRGDSYGLTRRSPEAYNTSVM